jgi:hypothetical protein
VTVISLAKREEESLCPGHRTRSIWHRINLGLLLLRRVRDEAHRFALVSIGANGPLRLQSRSLTSFRIGENGSRPSCSIRLAGAVFAATRENWRPFRFAGKVAREYNHMCTSG